MSRPPDPNEATSAAILPEASRGRVAPWLQKAGYRPCSLDERPAVAVVDLTVEEGEKALVALREGYAQYAILAIVEDSHEHAERSLELGADGFVAISAAEREFDLRLEAVRRLALGRLEQARREQDLAVLLDLTAHYASALDVATLLHDVTRRLAEELSIDRCALVLIDEERGVGHIVAASDDRAVRDLRIELARYPEIREAVRTGQPVVVDDVVNHPLLGEVKDAVAARGIAALAAVPLTVHNKTLGVLLLRASAGNRFHPHEISFAWTVAHATAIALRNARMVEGLRGQALKAEAQVAELSRYEEFFVYLSEGVVILESGGTIVSINPAGAGILGLTPESAKGRMFASFASPLSEPAMMELLAGIRRGERPRDLDLDAVSEDGRRLILCVSGAQIPGGAGAVLSVRDATEARALERELRKTKEFLEKLIDSSVDAIIATDTSGHVILYNKSAERVLGWTRKEALRGLDARALYPEGMAQKMRALIESEDHGGIGRLEPTRTELVAKGGERVPVLMSAALIYEGAKPAATVAVVSDLRERARLEAKLSRAEERLQEAEKQAVIVELAGTAAHELNQPLTSVMGYAELLRRKLKEQDPNFKKVDIIYREAERMAEIVRKIGKITRYETKAYVGNARIVDLDRAARDDD